MSGKGYVRKVSISSRDSKEHSSPRSIDELPRSNVFLAPRDTVAVRMCIREASGRFSRWVDNPENEFETRMDLCRDNGPNHRCYRISFIKKEKGAQFKNLVDLVEAEECNWKKFTRCIKLVFGGKEYMVIQLEDGIQHSYFLKIFKAILEVNGFLVRNKDFLYDEPTKRKVLTNYDPSNNFQPTKKKSSIAGLSDHLTLSPVPTPHFYEKGVEAWTRSDFTKWIKHIFVQSDRTLPPKTLYEFMQSTQPRKLFPDFIQYFSNRVLGTNTYTLSREIERYERNPARYESETLRDSLNNNTVRRVLKKECKKIEKNKGIFDIHYCLLLKKKIDLGGSDTLELIEHSMMTRFRFMWDLVVCADHLLSLLIYAKPFDDYIASVYEHFREEEERMFEKKQLEEQNVRKANQWRTDQQHILIDPEEWKCLLDEFNKSLGFKLHEVSFEMKIADEQNELRYTKKELITLPEKIKRLKERSSDMESKIVSQEVDILDIETEGMTDEEEDEKEKDHKKEEKRKKRKEKAERVLKNMNSKFLKIEEEIREARAKLRTLRETFGVTDEEDLEDDKVRKAEIREMEKHILDRHPLNQRYMNLRRTDIMEFYASERRVKLIRLHLLEKLDNLSKEGGMKEFSVKLVINVMQGFVQGGYVKRTALKTLDSFYTPSSLKYGLVHAFPQISNVGFHWFNNSLVRLADISETKSPFDIYREVVALDCMCPLLINRHTLLDRLVSLAEVIVRANVNYKYTDYNITGSNEGSLNCQEFADQMIKMLDATPFFKPATQYLEQLRLAILNKRSQDDKNLRFLKVSKEFSKIYGGVWEDEEEGEEDEEEKSYRPDKKKRIYFNTHKELDDFYFQCEVIDDEDEETVERFRLQFPGEYQLLKGFDRAFWMLGKGEKKENCPFHKPRVTIIGGALPENRGFFRRTTGRRVSGSPRQKRFSSSTSVDEEEEEEIKIKERKEEEEEEGEDDD